MDDVRILPKDIDPGDIWEKMALLREKNTWRPFALCVKSNKHAKFTNLKISRRFLFFFFTISHTVCLDSDLYLKLDDFTTFSILKTFDSRSWCEKKERMNAGKEKMVFYVEFVPRITLKRTVYALYLVATAGPFALINTWSKQNRDHFFFLSFFIWYSFSNKRVHFVYIDFTFHYLYSFGHKE